MKKIFLTCLLVGTMVMMMCMSVFAAEYPRDLPAIPGYDEDYQYLVSTSKDGIVYLLCISDKTGSFVVSPLSGFYNLTFVTDSTSYISKIYKLNSGKWESVSTDWSSSGDLNLVFISSSDDIMYATSNVTNDSGEVVFLATPLPTLAQTVLMNQEQALTNLSLTVGGVMKILVLCGVGCLALLTGLKLFGKVLPIFRN